MRADPEGFGGRAGDILARTFSLLAVLTGLALLVAIAIATKVAAQLGVSGSLPLIGQIIISLFLAHFAIDGYTDRWRKAGRLEPASELFNVAARFFALCSLWLLPLVVVGIEPRALASIQSSTIGTWATVVYLICLVVTPPPFLMAAVSARAWKDLVSPAHWRRLFAGRGDDVILVLVLYLGALATLMLFSMPVLLFAASRSMQVLRVTGGVIGLIATGMAIALLGRLCGSFARVEEGVETQPREARLNAVLRPQVPSAGVASPPARKTALVDAGQRLTKLQAETKDPAALVTALEALDEQHLPNPSVRNALCNAYLAAGRRDDAKRLARETIPLCHKGGNVALAALTAEPFIGDPDWLGLSIDEMSAMGETYRTIKHPASAARAFLRVLTERPDETRAVKGLIGVAGDLSQQPNQLSRALQIYDHLLAHCATSPFLDTIRQERDKLQRRMQIAGESLTG